MGMHATLTVNPRRKILYDHKSMHLFTWPPYIWTQSSYNIKVPLTSLLYSSRHCRFVIRRWLNSFDSLWFGFRFFPFFLLWFLFGISSSSSFSSYSSTILTSSFTFLLTLGRLVFCWCFRFGFFVGLALLGRSFFRLALLGSSLLRLALLRGSLLRLALLRVSLIRLALLRGSLRCCSLWFL